MPIYQRGGSFLLSIGSGSDRVRKSFKTYAEAQEQEQIELLIRKGALPKPEKTIEKSKGVSKGHSLIEAYRLTVQDVWSQNKTKSHEKTAKIVLRVIGDDTPVTDITTSLIRELVEEFEDQGNTGGTINSKLSALSMMLKTAADEGWLESLPRIKRRSPGTHRIRWLDAEEELEVLNMCEKLGLTALRDYIIVAIDTGFRRNELLEFRVKEFRGGMLNLHPDETKTSKARAIPPTDRVLDIIERRSNYVRLFDDFTAYGLRSHWNCLREAMGKLEDPQFVVHMLRHTCASRLAMQDKSAQFIQAWMGHATPLTTARYMHLAPGKLKEGAQALDDFRKMEVKLRRVV